MPIPADLFTGGVRGAWYDVSDMSTLFQDAAGTIPVTSVNDPVRLINDKSGNSNHLIIHTTGTPGIYKEFMGLKYIYCPSGAAYKTTTTQNLSIPLYIASAFSTPIGQSAPLFGVAIANAQRASLNGHTSLNRMSAYLRYDSPGPGILQLTSGGAEWAPQNAPMVADMLAVAGTLDHSSHGVAVRTTANGWTGSEALAGATLGINMSSASGTSNGLQNFYGGIICFADPGTTNRAAVNSYLKTLTTIPPDVGDFVVCMIGDSTGDKGETWIGAVREDSGEMLYRFTMYLAAQNPSKYVGYRLYSHDFSTYWPEIQVQAGTGGGSIRVYNASVGGKDVKYFTGAHFDTAIANIPEPDVFIWNHGHNMKGYPSPSTYIGGMEMVRMKWTGVPHIAIKQNPWRLSDAMLGILAALETTSTLYGDMPIANVYDEFESRGRDVSLYANSGDGIHHSYTPDGVETGASISNDAIVATWEAEWPIAPSREAFFLTKVDNLLQNGGFSVWDATEPSGWFLVGNGTLSKELVRVATGTLMEGIGSEQAAKLVSGASGDTYLQQTLSAVPYQGQTLTLAAVMDVDTGADVDSAPGTIEVLSDGTGSPVSTSQIANRGENGYCLIVTPTLVVPLDATTITVRLYATKPGISGDTAHFDRAILSVGEVPRDLTNSDYVIPPDPPEPYNPPSAMTTIYGPLESLGSAMAPSINTDILDGAGDKIAGVFCCPKAGTIDRIAVYCTAVSSPVSTNVRLEGVSAGAPSGSLIAAGTSGSFTPVAATLHIITLTASHVVAAGDLIAVVLNAPTAGVANSQTFNSRNSAVWPTPAHFPHALTDLSVGTYTQVSTLPMVVPIYSDGMYFNGCIPNALLSNTSFNNTSSPDERGNRWAQGGNMTCIGARVTLRGIAAGDNFNIKLYDTTANAAPIAVFSGVASTFFFSTSLAGAADVFWDGVELSQGSDYRLAFQPSTSNNISVSSYASANAQIRQAMSHYYATSRTRTADGDAGAWTDVPTSHYLIWPLFSEVSGNALLALRHGILMGNRGVK